MSKKSILFVCLGNICRSPMAEGVFLKLLEEDNQTQNFEIDSAGLINGHQGELADRRMILHASKRGYHLIHRSRPVNILDFETFDLIIGMDEDNIKRLTRLAPNKEALKRIFRMTDYCTRNNISSIPDPYYGTDKDFEQVIDLLEDAYEGLFKQLKSEDKQIKL